MIKKVRSNFSDRIYRINFNAVDMFSKEEEFICTIRLPTEEEAEMLMEDLYYGEYDAR